MGKNNFSNGKKNGKKKRNGKKTVSKLEDKSINTLVERRIQEIARAEAEAQRIKLCFRRFLFADYNPVHNLFAEGQTIDWDGKITAMDEIPMTDVLMEGTGVISDNPNTTEDESNTVVHFGSIHGTTILPLTGARSSNMIKIKGLSFDIRAIVHESTVNNQNLYPNIQLRYAIVMVEADFLTMTQAQIALFCTTKKLLRWNEWGYSNIIDRNLRTLDKTAKITVLKQGSMTFKQHDSYPIQKNDNLYYKFEDPLQMEYKENDRYGLLPVQKRFYTVIRSNIPGTGSGSDHTYAMPKVHGVSKVYYYEP